MLEAVLFALLLTAAALGVGYFVVAQRFHQTPEYLWRKRVFEHSATLTEQRRRLVAAAPPSPDQVLGEERRAVKESAQNEITLDRLTVFSGIGPGTIGLLRQSGVRTIPAVLRANLGVINGIGPQKAALLWAASRTILAECDADFDAGRSPRGAHFAEQAPAIGASARKAYDEYRAALSAIDAAMSAHHDSERLASDVTLMGYLRDQVVVGLDAERMRRSFPTPEFHQLETPLSPFPPARKSSPVDKDLERPAASRRLADAAEFGMFLVLVGGKNRNQRMMRLRIALRSIFTNEPESEIVAAINRHLKSNSRPDEWFNRLQSIVAVEDRDRLVDKVLGPSDLRSPDETKLADWIARHGVRRNANTSEPSDLRPLSKSTTKFVPSKAEASRGVQAQSSRSTPKESKDLLQELLAEPMPSPEIEPIRRHPQQDRLEAFARFGVMVALADGKAAQAELRLVRTFLAELFGHEPDLVRRIDPLVEFSTVAKPFVDHTISEAKRVAASDAELTRLYQWAVQISDVSSGRNDRETAILARIAEEWNVAPSSPSTSEPRVAPQAPAAIPTIVDSTPIDPRTELGIPADVEITVELVRRRYLFLVDQLDAVRLDGLGEEFTKLAAIKRNKVEAAANALLHPLGAPLVPQSEPPASDLRHNPDLDAVFGA